jgi:predicted amidohydrolase YtcJ
MLMPLLVAANLVLINGKVWTGDEKVRFVEAVAVEGNRIVAAGLDSSTTTFTSSTEAFNFPASVFATRHLHPSLRAASESSRPAPAKVPGSREASGTSSFGILTSFRRGR